MKTVHERVSSSRIQKISVVWKYVFYGLFLSCIPLILLSFYFIHLEKNNIAANEQLRYEKVAEAAANSFFENVQAMYSASVSLTTEIGLQDRYLSESIYNANHAVRMLSSYKKMLPVTSACGLYTYNEPNTVYYSDGVWKKDIFERFVITEEGLFDRILKNKNRICFSGWSEESQALICALPIVHSNESLPRRVFFFVMNSVSITNSFSMTTMSIPETRIAGIWDADGNLLFYNSACETGIPTLTHMQQNHLNTIDQSRNYYFTGNSNGYRVMLYVPLSVYKDHITANSSSLALIIAIDVLLCFMLVAIFTYLNYRPIKNLMNSIGLEAGRNSEFSAIQESYNRTSSRVAELQLENEDNQRLLVSHLLEKPLNGIALRNRETLVLEKVFGGQKGCFFVAVASISKESTPAVFEYADELGKILPIEMLSDGFLAYVCKTDSVNRYEQLLEEISQRCIPHIGAGSISVDFQSLHKSYLEAILALTRNGNTPVSMIDSVFSSMDDFSEEDRSVSLIQITRMLKNGDQAALNEIDRMFDRLLAADQPVSVSRYSCFQLIQKLQQSVMRMGLDFSDEQAAKILDSGNVAAMRNALFEHLNTVLESVRIANTETIRLLSQKIMQSVENEFANNAFNLSMLADSVGITEYTASHIFKEITGQNLQDYLKALRIKAAKNLLLCTDDSVNDIALSVGFSSCSYFIRIFKGEEGMTPAAYRQMQGNSEIPEH